MDLFAIFNQPRLHLQYAYKCSKYPTEILIPAKVWYVSISIISAEKYCAKF